MTFTSFCMGRCMSRGNDSPVHESETVIATKFYLDIIVCDLSARSCSSQFKQLLSVCPTISRSLRRWVFLPVWFWFLSFYLIFKNFKRFGQGEKIILDDFNCDFRVYHGQKHGNLPVFLKNRTLTFFWTPLVHHEHVVFKSGFLPYSYQISTPFLVWVAPMLYEVEPFRTTE